MFSSKDFEEIGGLVGGLVTSNIQVVSSSQAAAAYPTGLLTYIPLLAGNDDWIEFFFNASNTGDLPVTVIYAMSSSDDGIIELDVVKDARSLGSDPDAAPPTAVMEDFTPGTGTTVKMLTFTVNVAEGDTGRIRMTRISAGTTGTDHQGDMRVIGIYA